MDRRLIDHSKYIEAAADNSYDLGAFAGIGEDDIRKYLEAEFNTILGFNDDIEMKQRRLEKFSVPSAELEDYDHKIIEYDSGRPVLAGIRHLGGNPEKPFVYAWPGFTPDDGDEIIRIKENILPYFEKFKPEYINIWLSGKSGAYDDILKIAEPAQRLYLGEVMKIKDGRKPQGSVSSVLEMVEDDEYFKWYVNVYAQFHSENPDLRDRVEVNDLQLMENCRQQGLLFYYKIDGQVAGIIAGEYTDIFDKKSVYLDEILISKEYRGRGHAAAMLAAFINGFNPGVEYIWSYVDSRNTASVKTALNAGQKIISEEFFV